MDNIRGERLTILSVLDYYVVFLCATPSRLPLFYLSVSEPLTVIHFSINQGHSLLNTPSIFLKRTARINDFSSSNHRQSKNLLAMMAVMRIIAALFQNLLPDLPLHSSQVQTFFIPDSFKNNFGEKKHWSRVYLEHPSSLHKLTGRLKTKSYEFYPKNAHRYWESSAHEKICAHWQNRHRKGQSPRRCTTLPGPRG